MMPSRPVVEPATPPTPMIESTVEMKIANLLKWRIGLDSSSVGQSMINLAIHQRMAECGISQEEEYWERLKTSENELQEMIEAVVVPETWFFRGREAFDALVHLVMTEWLPTHAAGVLRVLSLACSTGEEPYSIAMSLMDAGLPTARFRIDAVDISQRALSFAKRAIYGRKSFRGQDIGFRERYFAVSSDSAEEYCLSQQVAALVHFKHGNLLAMDLQPRMKPYDIIFCRNTLIYFDACTQKAVSSMMESLLAPTGTLFVGPAEAFALNHTKLSWTRRSLAFAFRRNVGSPGTPQGKECGSDHQDPAERRSRVGPTIVVKSPAQSSGELPPSARLTAVATNSSTQTATPATSAVPAPTGVSIRECADHAASELESAGSLADEGKLVEAAAACEAHLRKWGASASAYYLLALVNDGLGLEEKAAGCYRKTFYLEPGHAEAMIHLSLLLEKQGDVSEARRLRERALRVEKRAGA